MILFQAISCFSQSLSLFPIPRPLPLRLSQVCQILASINYQSVLEMDYQAIRRLIQTGPRKMVIEVMEEVTRKWRLCTRYLICLNGTNNSYSAGENLHYSLDGWRGGAGPIKKRGFYLTSIILFDSFLPHLFTSHDMMTIPIHCTEHALQVH